MTGVSIRSYIAGLRVCKKENHQEHVLKYSVLVSACVVRTAGKPVYNGDRVLRLKIKVSKYCILKLDFYTTKCGLYSEQDLSRILCLNRCGPLPRHVRGPAWTPLSLPPKAGRGQRSENKLHGNADSHSCRKLFNIWQIWNIFCVYNFQVCRS